MGPDDRFIKEENTLRDIVEAKNIKEMKVNLKKLKRVASYC